MLRIIATTVVLGFAVCACGPQRTTVAPKLETGITSSNGGGAAALGNAPDIPLGRSGSAAGPGQTQAPNRLAR